MRADNHEPLDQIAKFADVSGPTVSGEHGQSCVADLLGFAAIGSGEFSEKMARQNGYVLNALAQSWNREGYYVQAIKKVFPKQTPGNLILELFIRCGDHAHVHGCRVIGSHTLEPLLLEGSKYLGLRTQTHIADYLIALAEFLAKAPIFQFQAQKFERPFHRLHCFLERERLFDEIEGAQFRGPNRCLDIAVSRDHDHHRKMPVAAHALECFDSIHLRQPDIEQHQIDTILRKTRQALLARADRFDCITFFGQDGGKRIAYSRFVVDDKNGLRHKMLKGWRAEERVCRSSSTSKNCLLL